MLRKPQSWGGQLPARPGRVGPTDEAGETGERAHRRPQTLGKPKVDKGDPACKCERGLLASSGTAPVSGNSTEALLRSGRIPGVSRLGEEPGELLVVQCGPALRRGWSGERCKQLRRSRRQPRHHGDIPSDQRHGGEKDRSEHQGEKEDHLTNVPDVRCTTPGPKVPPSPQDICFAAGGAVQAAAPFVAVQSCRKPPFTALGLDRPSTTNPG